MKRLAALFVCALPLGVLFQEPGFAQVTVYDPANHAQNVLQAARALQELDNQLRQLAHELDMIEKMARNLESLPVNVAHAILRDRIARIEALMREVEGIGYQTEEIGRGYDALYPVFENTAAPRQAALTAAARERWRQSRSAWRHALEVSAATRENNEADASALERLVDESQAAIGQLQAMQAGNQLSALTTQQLIQMEAALAAHARAEAMERAKDLAEAERGRARLQSFLGE